MNRGFDVGVVQRFRHLFARRNPLGRLSESMAHDGDDGVSNLHPVAGGGRLSRNPFGGEFHPMVGAKSGSPGLLHFAFRDLRAADRHDP